MKKILLLAVAICCTVMASAYEGALSGLFSINEKGDQIQFSKGNLQYQAYTKKWRFAEKQYDIIGYDNEKINLMYSGWIDLFGWATANLPTQIDGNPGEYPTTFIDWGSKAISNGGNETFAWRTLTDDEWYYLLNERFYQSTSTHFYCPAEVNHIKGWILLPDDWDDSLISDYYERQTYTAEQWQPLEDAGAVFLPAAGMRGNNDDYYCKKVDGVNYSGHYWTSSIQNSKNGKEICFLKEYAPDVKYNSKNLGYSVRLVRVACGGCSKLFTVTFKDWDGEEITKRKARIGNAVKGPNAPTRDGYEFIGWNTDFSNVTSDLVVIALYKKLKTLTGRFSVAADKQVTFSSGNLQYNADKKKWQFAENQYDFVGGDNTNISSTYDGWIDLFGWGTSGYIDKQPYMTSDTDYDYGDGASDLTGTNYDWGEYASISNGGNMDWRTLSAGEWDYLLQTRDGAASKHGNATVAGNKGLVLLPDKWQLPEGLSFTADPTDWTTNTYTADQWAEMEAAGAVFLPASGRRINGGTIYNFKTNCRGYYWTASASGEDRASFLDFGEAQAAQNSTDYRSMGFAVRQASDVVIKTVSNPTITLSETTFVYDGTAKTPTVTVMDGSTVIPASEYTVGYSNNVNAGTATVTITDNEDGDYNISGSTTFTITAKTVSSPTITLEKTYYFYDGTAKTPTVTVKDGETEIPASEYTVGYSNNTNVGMATVTITDKDGGNYIVVGSATFEIGLKGDANGDNKVDAADIVEMVNETKGQPSVKFKKNNADIDGNGQITDADITEVAKIILAE